MKVMKTIGFERVVGINHNDIIMVTEAIDKEKIQNSVNQEGKLFLLDNKFGDLIQIDLTDKIKSKLDSIEVKQTYKLIFDKFFQEVFLLKLDYIEKTEETVDEIKKEKTKVNKKPGFCKKYNNYYNMFINEKINPSEVYNEKIVRTNKIGIAINENSEYQLIFNDYKTKIIFKDIDDFIEKYKSDFKNVKSYNSQYLYLFVPEYITKNKRSSFAYINVGHIRELIK